MSAARSGFSLIELLIATAILSILLTAITLMVQAAVVEAGKSKVVMTATMLAQDHIEAIRNAPYAKVGTVGGIPDGVFPAIETVSINGLAYTTSLMIIYVDDPFDGVAPADTSPTDYKRVRVAVSWDGLFATKDPVVMVTDISSKAVEADEGGGTIALTVFDALGTVIPNAAVTLRAPSLTPPIDVTLTSDGNGKITIPGAKPGIECYEVTTTKSGYTTDRTYSRAEVANPAKPHLSVLPSEITTASFTIDIPSNVTFRAVRSAAFGYTPFQGVNFRLHGLKEIGRTALDQPVYKTDISLTTGTGGSITRNNLEWDTYIVEIPTGSTVDFAGSTPFTPFSLSPHSTVGFTMVVVPNTPHTALIRLTDNLMAPIASASVELKNELMSYSATQSTAMGSNPDKSQAFFTDLPSTLAPYSLTITAEGFLPVATEATISGDVIEDYIVNPL